MNKLEIAYNRIYYPLYRIICDKENDIDFIIDKAKFYLNKYEKYADRSTLRAYDILCQSDTNAKKKRALKNFQNNIFDKNTTLRRRLGYLEPGILQMYMYSSDSLKSSLRILFELCGIYICLVFCSIFVKNVQIVAVFIAIFGFLFIVMILELVCKFAKFVYYFIKK